MKGRIAQDMVEKAVGIHQPPLTEQAAGLAPFLAGGEKEDGGCQENDVFTESCHDSQF